VTVVEDNVRPLRSADAAARTVSRVAQVEVTTFEDVEAVGARYRTGQAVLFDLSGATAGTPRRVVDFVAGLTYALRGELTKVGARAFLLVPEGARVTDEERRRLTELGYRLPAGSET
jgi:cell division inhibitor SepF